MVSRLLALLMLISCLLAGEVVVLPVGCKARRLELCGLLVALESTELVLGVAWI